MCCSLCVTACVPRANTPTDLFVFQIFYKGQVTLTSHASHDALCLCRLNVLCIGEGEVYEIFGACQVQVGLHATELL